MPRLTNKNFYNKNKDLVKAFFKYIKRNALF